MNNIIILAAGKGTRMNSDLPKVLVQLCEKSMIVHLLTSIYDSQVNMKPIIVVSPDNYDIIKEEISGFDVKFAIQNEQLGTGHAVASAQDQISSRAEYSIVFYGDHPLIQPDTIQRLSDIIEKNISEPIIMMTTTVDNFDDENSNFLSWGRVIRENGNIKQIIEYKDATPEQRGILEINPGFYCFKNDWLWENINKIENNNKQNEFYLTDLIKIAVDQGYNIVDLSVEPWQTIGVNSQQELQWAEKIYKEKVIKK